MRKTIRATIPINTIGSKFFKVLESCVRRLTTVTTKKRNALICMMRISSLRKSYPFLIICRIRSRTDELVIERRGISIFVLSHHFRVVKLSSYDFRLIASDCKPLRSAVHCVHTGAHVAKHFAFTHCSESNLYGVVDAQLGVVEAELLATVN